MSDRELPGSGGAVHADGGPPRLSIFAIPKPFRGVSGQLQRTALASWSRLAPQVEILLLGDEPGVAAAAAEFAARHWPALPRNEHGTPLVGPAFAIAAEQCATPLLAYCNADLILLDDWLPAVTRLETLAAGPFLACGRRINIPLERGLDFRAATNAAELQRWAAEGELESLLCKDYFVFQRGTFSQLPPFAVGRGNWDSWLVQHAKQRGIPVVDLSSAVHVLHPNHDHGHVAGGRVASYWHGAEARENQRVGGGKYWVRGTAANWELTADGWRRCRGARWNWPFWRDWPRTARLFWQLLRPAGGSVPPATTAPRPPAPLGDKQC